VLLKLFSDIDFVRLCRNFITKGFIGVIFLSNSQQLAPIVGQGIERIKHQWIQNGILRSSPGVTTLGCGW
jgi:hypothetical protein